MHGPIIDKRPYPTYSEREVGDNKLNLNMRLFKRILLGVIILLGIVFAFRNQLYNVTVNYEIHGERPSFNIENKQLIDFIENNIHKNQYDAKTLIKLSLDITAKALEFEPGPASNDPNICFVEQHANCVGYAAFQAAVCNYLFHKFGMESQWVAQPLKGQLYFLGVNVHPYFKGPFFRDHDFVKIENTETKQQFYTDPSFYDYLHVDFVSLKPGLGMLSVE